LPAPQAALLRLPELERRFAADHAAVLPDTSASWGGMFSWVVVHALGKLTGASDYAEQSRSWIDEWRLGRILSGVLRELGADEQAAWQAVQMLKYLTSYQDWFRSPELQPPARLLGSLLADGEVRQLLRINRYQGVLWFDKGAFEQLLGWLARVALVSLSADGQGASQDTIAACYALLGQLRDAAAKSGYQLEKLRSLVQS